MPGTFRCGRALSQDAQKCIESTTRGSWGSDLMRRSRRRRPPKGPVRPRRADLSPPLDFAKIHPYGILNTCINAVHVFWVPRNTSSLFL
jgi:hypothetical protein